MHKHLHIFLCALCFSVVSTPLNHLFAQNTKRSLSNEKWSFRKSNETKYYPAKVPGTIHTDLFTNKLIPDPFFADNEKQLQWVEEERWEYTSVFTISKKEMANSHIELEFEGLDTYASVYLNDSLILKADNMFRTWTVDIKKHARQGKNVLSIVFESAVKKGKAEAKKLSYTLPGDEKVFTRKAQYQYGWDWGPRFVTCGIWKDIKLNCWSRVKIRDVNCIQTKLTDTLAELVFEISLEQDINEVLYPVVYQTKPDSSAGMYFPGAFVHAEKGKNKATVYYYIKNPKRWWSNGLGEAHLYHFTIAMSKKSGPVDQVNMNVGLRTIELVQQKDNVGTSFYFKLNGVPVFMKGANYIPPDNFLPRVTKNNYEEIVNKAALANMNMLRVWGGGVYADDEFYNACDRKGILVWQDLMFACAMYPGDEHFISNVKQEVADNVNRLQNHACIALWCGNNENDEGWKNWGWQKQYNYSKADSAKIWNDYTKVFHDVIPKTLDSIAPKSIYWPSSPSIGWGRKESLLQGDSHYWGVWWGMEPFEAYNKKTGRFMSEYGFQGTPDLSTFQKVDTDKNPHFSSVSYSYHQKHPTGDKTIRTYMERDYKVPPVLEDFIYVSQLLQARGLKTAIEAHRRVKPYCMGSLYWQLNDCWPVTSWSSMDYYGNWKAAHYEAKRLFSPVIVSAEEKNDSVYIYVVSDLPSDLKGGLQICLMDLQGKILLKEDQLIIAEANTSRIYLKYHRNYFLSKIEPGNCFLNIKLANAEKEFASVNHYFEKPKQLKLSKPMITYKLTDQHTIELTSDVLARDVFLECNGCFFEENYFDLLPGVSKKIKIKQKTPSSAIQVSIKSLFDVN